MGTNRKILVLLDAHAVLHRAFHALPDFTSSKGEPTGALYGFTALIIKIIREINPDYIAAAYDLPKPTFRHIAYDQYKAGRVKIDDSLVKQINRSHDILKAFNIPVYSAAGFEADDVLGTIVEKVKKSPDDDQIKIIIASGDMDTLQLVRGEDVVVYTLKKGINDTIIYDEKAVEQRYGFGPELVVDYKALRGDPSDNLLGVKGIGEKTATGLVKKIGSIENLYKEIKKGDAKTLGLTPRIFDLLKNGEEEALFSKTLAEIRKDAPIDFSLGKISWKDGFDKEQVLSIFNELGFKSLFDRLRGQNRKEDQISSPSVGIGGEKKEVKTGTIVPYVLLETVEKPLAKILTEMEKNGVLLDIDYLKKLSAEKHKELDLLENKIWKLAGREFNINSPKQLGEVLFVKLELGGARQKKTATGAYSTNIAQLEKLKGSHGIIVEIIEHREISKLLSTYIDALPKTIDENKRVHTHFDSFGTATGRLSSENPNLQNIPKRSERGREVRRAFVADHGFKLIDFDYSQIDLRSAAILSGDNNLVALFQGGKDIHAAAAAKVFSVDLEAVTAEMRRKIKVINFGILYGMGVNALKQNLGGTKDEAQKFYEDYFKNFSKLRSYLEETKKFARENGWTETLFGRRRYLPEIMSGPEYIKKEAERMAINMPIQGTSADLIKLAMVKINQKLEEIGLRNDARMLLQIHDELLFEIRGISLEKAIPIIKGAMESIYPLQSAEEKLLSEKFKINDLPDIPLAVNVEIGNNWGEMSIHSK